MTDPKVPHPLLKSYKAWKDAEAINSASWKTYVKETGDIRHRSSQGRSTKGMLRTASSSQRTLDQIMENL